MRDRHHLLAVHAGHVVQQIEGDAVDLGDVLRLVDRVPSFTSSTMTRVLAVPNMKRYFVYNWMYGCPGG